MQLQEFVEQWTMQAKYIIANHHDRIRQDIKKCTQPRKDRQGNVQPGKAVVNMYPFTVQELAAKMLEERMSQLGQKYQIMSPVQEASLMLEVLAEQQQSNQLSYFKEKNVLEMNTAKQMVADLKLIRMNGGLEPLKNYKENAKYQDLFTLGCVYVEKQNKQNLYDSVRVIEQAIELWNELENPEPKLLGIYADLEVSQLEKDYLNMISNNNPVFLKIPWIEGKEPPEKAWKREEKYYAETEGLGSVYETECETRELAYKAFTFIKSYGLHNEIKGVVKEILSKKLRYEEVQIITCKEDNNKIMVDYLEKLSIPYCMKQGISGKYSAVYSIVSDMFAYMEQGQNIEIFKKILRNPAMSSPEKGEIKVSKPMLCKIVEKGVILGNEFKPAKQIREELKEPSLEGKNEHDIKEERNKLAIDFITEMIKEIHAIFDTTTQADFLHSIAGFLLKYVGKMYRAEGYQFAGACKQSAIVFGDSLNHQNTMESRKKLVLHILEGEHICKKTQEQGSILISSLDAIAVASRPHVYLVGQNGKDFPGTFRESPVLLDKERIELGLLADLVSKEEERKKYHLLQVLSSNDIDTLTISYVYYDTVHMREQNPSSFYQKLWMECKAKEKEKKEKGEIAESELKEKEVGFAELEKEQILEKRERYLSISDQDSVSIYKKQLFSDEGVKTDTVGESITVEDEKSDTVGENITEEEKTKQTIYSATALEEYIDCPKKYYYKRVAKINEPEKNPKKPSQWLNAAEKGNFVHMVLQKYVENCFIRKLASDKNPKEQIDIMKKICSNTLTLEEKTYEDIFAECLKEMESLVPVVSENAYTQESNSIKTDCENELRQMIEQMKKNHTYPIAVEHEVKGNISLSEEKEIAMRGFIDRVDYQWNDGTYVIVDYKSGKKKYKEALRSDGKDEVIQDYFYALAYEKEHENEERLVTKSRFLFPCDSQESIDTDISKEKVEVTQKIKNVIDGIEAGDFERCKSAREEINPCTFCGYEPLCRGTRMLEREGGCADE